MATVDASNGSSSTTERRAPAAVPVPPAAAAAAAPQAAVAIPPPAAAPPQPSTSRPATAATAPAAAAAQQQLQRAAPTKPAPAAVSPLDLVIDEVLAGDFSMPERDLMADELAYSYFSTVREAAGDDLDPETSAQLNQLAAISQADKEAIMQKTNRVARRVLRPLGYKMLQVQGLDPATISPAAARAALEADLTPEQQAAVDEEAERLFKEVYLPELQEAAEDVELQDPDEAWEEFGRDVLARQPQEQQQQSSAAVAVPAALVGAVVALVVSKLFGWIQRRRQRRFDQSGSDYYYEEEEEMGTGTDSARDDASAYAE